MSSTMYFQLLGHVYLAAHTCTHDANVAQTLSKVGFDKSRVERGIKLAEEGEALIDQKTLDSVDNKTLDHNTHSAVMELEIWQQTVKLRLRKQGFDDAFIKEALGHDVHAHKHTLTAIVQALRSIHTLRALNKDQITQYGDKRRLHDMIMRGNSLLKRLYKTTEYFMMPSSVSPPSMAIFEHIDALNISMGDWLKLLDASASKCTKDFAHLGKAGCMPYGVGIPVGGSSSEVLRHHRAKREAPNHGEAHATSGWSVGRHSNNENLGQGWVERTYDHG